MKRNAEITVFISLMLVIMCGFILAVIESAQIVSAKEQATFVLRNSLDSAMSEYNKALFDRYGLIFVDTAYKEQESGTERFKQHLTEYINVNLKCDDNAYMCRLELNNIEAVMVEYADNCGYAPLFDQITLCVNPIDYMDDENKILDSYIVSKMIQVPYDWTAHMSDIETNDKLIYIKNYIEDEMKKDSVGDFCFENCIAHAKVRAEFTTESGYSFCVSNEK